MGLWGGGRFGRRWAFGGGGDSVEGGPLGGGDSVEGGPLGGGRFGRRWAFWGAPGRTQNRFSRKKTTKLERVPMPNWEGGGGSFNHCEPPPPPIRACHTTGSDVELIGSQTIARPHVILSNLASLPGSIPTSKERRYPHVHTRRTDLYMHISGI